jgi:2-octaprenyl-6-methoxyphenol hydroxylase
MTFDIAIIGAGLNGLTAALAMGSKSLRRPLRVVLIDSKDPFATSTDTRGSALTLATQRMLAALGCWDSLRAHAEEMRDIIVTDGTKPIAERATLLRFATENGRPAAAAIVENGVLLAVLRDAVMNSPAITTRFGQAVAEISFGPGLAQVKLADDQMIKASLVIGADGRASRTRQAARIEVETKDYGQGALTFTIAHELPHGGRAEEHFLAHGVLAVLPLTGNRSSIVWADSRARADALMVLDDDAFIAAFTTTLGTHLGSLRLASKRNCYPLGLQIAKDLAGPRLALIGDAAHVIHPLAGLGLNLGFKDAAALAQVLADAVALGEDPGSVAVLDRYVQLRRFDTVATSFSIDRMNALFANDNPLLTGLRGLGLKLVDRIPVAKELFMKEAAGLTGSPPRLMRGLQP